MFANAIMGHLVGDFLLQNDYIAANKKRSHLICGLHCAIWAGFVLAFSGAPWQWFGPLFVTHFAQDRWNLIPKYMEATGQSDFAYGRCAPWSVIIVDQVWHLLMLWCMSRWQGGY